jgi:hypothetical protein
VYRKSVRVFAKYGSKRRRVYFGGGKTAVPIIAVNDVGRRAYSLAERGAAKAKRS